MTNTANFNWPLQECDFQGHKNALIDIDAKLKTVITAITVDSAVLVGGTVTVANTDIADTNNIIYNRSVTGGTPGHLSYVINAGTSIVFTSSSAADTSTIVYQIL